jgi:hypothetical protein
MNLAAVVWVRWLLLAGLMLTLASAADAVGASSVQVQERGIVIVPLEPPPLVFGPGVDVGAALASHAGAGMSYSLSETTAQAGRALWVLSGIVMLVDAPRQSRIADREAQSAEAILSSEGVWVPTVVLAQEAQTMLQAAGVSQVRVSEHLRAVPGIESRARTFTMHNWYQPVKDWYEEDTSPFQYSGPEVQPGELVLEVGLGNYEVMKDTMFVMIYTKLVDPATGMTIARERKYKYPTVGKTEPLFRGDASGFKSTFLDVTRPALRECLQKLKVLPAR